jgi:hypothetical protein
MDLKRPDVVVLGAEWPERALLRAQLIAEGHEVVAIDVWPIPRLYFRPGMEPRALLIDLYGLPDPRRTLDEVRAQIPPERVVVLTALGAIAGDEVRSLGFNVVQRPASVGQVVAAVAALLSERQDGRSSGQTFR